MSDLMPVPDVLRAYLANLDHNIATARVGASEQIREIGHYPPRSREDEAADDQSRRTLWHHHMARIEPMLRERERILDHLARIESYRMRPPAIVVNKNAETLALSTQPAPSTPHHGPAR